MDKEILQNQDSAASQLPWQPCAICGGHTHMDVEDGAPVRICDEPDCGFIDYDV